MYNQLIINNLEGVWFRQPAIEKCAYKRALKIVMFGISLPGSLRGITANSDNMILSTFIDGVD